VSADELRDAREELFGSFLTLLELSWSGEPVTEAELLDATNALHAAVDELEDAIHADHRAVPES
jgi:hypothetical protein